MLFFSPSKRWTFLSLISRSFNLSPKASPIRMPVRKSRRIRARSRMSSITERSFLTSAGFMARGRASGSFSLMPRFRRDPEMTSCSIRKCRKAIMQASLVRTVEIRNPRSCSCSMKASRSTRSIFSISLLPDFP